MRQIYSTAFYEATLTLTGVTESAWTVPADFVDVVHSIDAYSTTGAAVTLYFGDASLGRAIQLQLPATGATTWRGRQAWNGGQALSFFGASGTVRVKISGYRLSA